jgi:multidrug efflux pump subunit AcrA (membrane-fusion protein)
METLEIAVDSIKVKYEISKIRRLESRIKSYGKISSKNSQNLVFLRSGIINKINVNNGERVSKGEQIIYIDLVYYSAS